MKSVGAYQAKTPLSGLLDELSRGASISITRKGVPVATMPGDPAVLVLMVVPGVDRPIEREDCGP